MKTIIVIETAEELLDFADPHRQEGDTKPFLGNQAKLIFETQFKSIRLEGTEGFILSEKITMEELLKELLAQANFHMHIT